MASILYINTKENLAGSLSRYMEVTLPSHSFETVKPPQAVDKIRQKPYDLVVLGFDMEPQAAIGLAKTLRETEKFAGPLMICYEDEAAHAQFRDALAGSNVTISNATGGAMKLRGQIEAVLRSVPVVKTPAKPSAERK